jgi:hypothetical protein
MPPGDIRGGRCLRTPLGSGRRGAAWFRVRRGRWVL